MLKKTSTQQDFKAYLANLTSQLDLFGKPPIFKVLKKDQFTTKLGISLTVGIAALSIFYLLYLLNNVFNNENPSIVQTDYAAIDSMPIPLYKANFTMGILVTNTQLSALQTLGTVFNIKVQNCMRTRVLNTTTAKTQVSLTQTKRLKFRCVDYPVESCNMNKHFVTDYQKQFFASFNLSYVYCLNSDQWDSRAPVLQGTASSNTFQYLTITVTQCVNGTNKTCASPAIINSTLASGYYAVYASDNLIQMNSAEQPFQQAINLQYTALSNLNSLQIFDTRKLTVTESDQGRVLNDVVSNSSIVTSSNQQSQGLYNQQYLIYHTILLDQKKTIYSRTYQKVQEVLGTIGGLFQVMYFLTQILITPMVMLMMNLSLANKVFRFFHEADEEVSQNQELKSQITKKIKTSIFKSYKIGDLKDKAHIQRFLKQKQKSLQLSSKEILLLLCGCRNKERKQIDYATQKIANKLDVEFLLTKLFEIDKLKSILFNKEQLHVFNYLPKPTIPASLFEKGNEEKLRQFEANPHFNFMLQEEKSDYDKLLDAYQAYQTIRQGHSSVDQQLLNHLDHEIVELFLNIGKGQTNIEIGMMSSMITPIASPRSSNGNENSAIFSEHPRVMSEFQMDRVIP